MKLRLPSEEADWFERCAKVGAKVDIALLRRHMDTTDWTPPAEIEPGIWPLTCGANTLFCYSCRVPGSSTDYACVYSISLLDPSPANGCLQRSEAEALEIARRLSGGESDIR